MVGRHSGRGELGCGVRRDERGQVFTRAVDEGEVVAHVDRYAAKHRPYVVERLSNLQEVADDEGDAEAGTGTWSAAEGQGDCEARIVHAVNEAPQAISGAEDASARKGVRVDHMLEEVQSVVVVADEQRSAATERGLGTPGQEAWRVPQREESGCALVAAGELHEALPGGYELGHVV